MGWKTCLVVHFTAGVVSEPINMAQVIAERIEQEFPEEVQKVVIGTTEVT